LRTANILLEEILNEGNGTLKLKETSTTKQTNAPEKTEILCQTGPISIAGQTATGADIVVFRNDEDDEMDRTSKAPTTLYNNLVPSELN
jgi:hypothetical protein